MVPASDLLRHAVRAALWAAERTGGLVDPTLVGELEQLGYARFARRRRARDLVRGARRGAAPASGAAQPGQPLAQDPRDDTAGTVVRPPGVRLDSGGAGKGLAADMAAGLLHGYARFVVDCGGDLRVGGPARRTTRTEIEVEHPLTGEPHARAAGRGWRCGDLRHQRPPVAHGAGRFAHHLLDPETGEPAWTGLVGVTALGSTALEAETLAKAALLSGPEGGRAWLAQHGGVLVHDSGKAERVGLRELAPQRVRFVIPAHTRAA